MLRRTVLAGSIILTMAACSGEGRHGFGEGNRSGAQAPTAPAGSAYLMGHKSSASPAAGKEASHPSSAHETELMRAMGLQITEGKIVIDTGKSKRFFENLERQIHKSMQTGVQKIEKHSPSAADLGIHIQKDRITVDLNQTAGFLREWGETMKVLGEELDRSLAPVRP